MPTVRPWYEPFNGMCIKREFPVARKEHMCTRCGGLIPAGEQYMREIWRDERQTHSLKFHKERVQCLA